MPFCPDPNHSMQRKKKVRCRLSRQGQQLIFMWLLGLVEKRIQVASENMANYTQYGFLCFEEEISNSS